MLVKAYIYGQLFLMQASTFFRREIFDRVGGLNVKNRISWDGELFLNMALTGGRFAVVDQFWSAYRIHERSITGTKSNQERLRRSHEEIFSTVMGKAARKNRHSSQFLAIWILPENPEPQEDTWGADSPRASFRPALLKQLTDSRGGPRRSEEEAL